MLSPALRSRMIEHLRSRREAYVDHGMRGSKGEGPGALQRRDMEQMIDGFTALMTEAITGEAREVRSFYIETVVPSLIKHGTSGPEFIQGALEFGVMLAIDIAVSIEGEDRAVASAWLASFWGEYAADLVRATQEVAS